MFFVLDAMLIPQVLVILGVEIVVFGSVVRHLNSKGSVKILGTVLTIFSVLNFLRHSTFFIVISRIGELFDNTPEFKWFLTREAIWLVISIWILSRGLRLVKKEEDLGFDNYKESQEFKILSIGVVLLLILEIPIFGIHGGFAGRIHGHGFWDGGTHIH